MRGVKFKDKSLYTRYRGMLARCYNENSVSYALYGGRGIGVCIRWRESYQNFYDDMGLPPTPKHTLGRIEGAGNYEPSNCRWETSTEQARNISRNRILEFDGKSMCMAEWAEHVGLTYEALAYRLNGLHWSVERALTTPTLSPGDPVRWETRRRNHTSPIAAAKKAKAAV